MLKRAVDCNVSLNRQLDDKFEQADVDNYLNKRIKVLDGRIPGSMELKMTQNTLQPPSDSVDVLDVIKGVIDVEEAAVNQYQIIIEATEGVDPVTQDLCITLKGDEEEHRREFKGFLQEALKM